MYKYCVENEYTSKPGVSLSDIGTNIQNVGFPRQIGKLSRLLQRRADKFEVYEHVVQGTFVYAVVPPRVIRQPQPSGNHSMNPNGLSVAPPEPLSRLVIIVADLCIVLSCTYA